jgi:hypothetical protein
MRIATFAEFWPYYVREHSLPGTRALHFIGSTAALGCFVGALITGRWGLLLIGLIIGYAFAWTGHFFIEHNKPATFKYPLWSFAADWRMWSLILRGKMDAEVTRARATKA